jgi:hypothetical protein
VAYIVWFSMDKYETIDGKDWTETELKDVRDRDASLVRRQANVDWLNVEEGQTAQLQQQ